MHLAAGLLLVIAYLALSINSYLETHAFGRFRSATAGSARPRRASG
jgi:hypothetical protein